MEDLVTPNLGIISERAFYYWKSLPLSAKSFFGLDDMIADAVLQVVRASKYYNAERAKISTFVWWTANNHCLSVLYHYQTLKYSAVDISTIEDLETPPSRPDSGVTFLEAANKVEQLLELAAGSSSELADFLEVMFCGTKIPTYQKRDYWAANWPPELLQEFTKAVQRFHISYDDLRLVLSGI